MSDSFIKPDNWPDLTTREKVIWWLSQLLQQDKEVFVDTALLVDDLGMDSLDIVEVIMRLEDEFELFITDQEAEKLKTVGLLVGYVEKNLSGVIPNVRPLLEKNYNGGPDFE